MKAIEFGAEDLLTAAHLFKSVAQRSTTLLAVTSGQHSLTYRELLARAGGVAAMLRSAGVNRGDVVATLLERSELCLIASLGAWAVGAAYVHLESSDPDRRLINLIDQTKPSILLVDDDYAERKIDFDKRC